MNKSPVYDVLKKPMMFFLLFIIFFGNAFAMKIKIIGIVPNLYRVGIIVLFITLLIMSVDRDFSLKKFPLPYILFMSLMLFWLVWGACSIFISPYVIFNDGVRELFNIFLGMLSVFCFYELCKTKDDLVFVAKIIRIFLLVICVFCFIEIFTGVRFHTSKYANDSNLWFLYDLKQFKQNTIYTTTFLFFNENELSTVLVIFSPFIFVNFTKNWKINALTILQTIFILMILMQNDANIAQYALIFGIIVWGILKNKEWQGYTSVIACMVTVQVFLKNISPHIGEVIASQVQNMSHGGGSLYVRLQIYLQTIKSCLETSLMGTGPNSFSNYFLMNDIKIRLINPHNLWFEILFQYGIIVFTCFVGICVYFFIKNIKLYAIYKNDHIIRAIFMLTIYVFASIGPSSFISNCQQWLVFAICLVIFNIFKNDKEEISE